MSDLAEFLWDVLTDEPKTRGELMEILGEKDRAIRRAVTELRKHGYNVASSSSVGGYWRGNEDDRKRTIREYRAKAYEELAIAYALERGEDYQMVMPLEQMAEALRCG